MSREKRSVSFHRWNDTEQAFYSEKFKKIPRSKRFKNLSLADRIKSEMKTPSEKWWLTNSNNKGQFCSRNLEQPQRMHPVL